MLQLFPATFSDKRAGTLIPTNVNHPHVLQDYLQTLAEAAEAAKAPQDKLLFGYAELKYRIAGGGKCAMCRSHVRHVVPVFATRENGEQLAYDCLCQRCLLGEIGLAEEVELRIGDASVHYKRKAEKAEPVTRTFTHPNKISGRDGDN
jgi:hypothetical protein